MGEVMRRVAVEGRKPEAVGGGGHRRNGAVSGERQHRPDVVASRELLDRRGITDVGDFGDVGPAEPLGVGVVVHDNNAMPETTRVDDRGALVATRADEKDSGHGAMLDVFRQLGGITEGSTTIPAWRSRASAS